MSHVEKEESEGARLATEGVKKIGGKKTDQRRRTMVDPSLHRSEEKEVDDG